MILTIIKDRNFLKRCYSPQNEKNKAIRTKIRTRALTHLGAFSGFDGKNQRRLSFFRRFISSSVFHVHFFAREPYVALLYDSFFLGYQYVLLKNRVTIFASLYGYLTKDDFCNRKINYPVAKLKKTSLS